MAKFDVLGFSLECLNPADYIPNVSGYTYRIEFRNDTTGLSVFRYVDYMQAKNLVMAVIIARTDVPNEYLPVTFEAII